MAPQKDSNGIATAALVCGIISIVIAPIPLISPVLGILAIVFGVLSLKTLHRSKAIAGIATGAVGALLSIVLISMIFIALPALQRSQRDSARKADVAAASSEVVSYMTNYRGEMPDSRWLEGLSYSQIDTIAGSGVATTTTAIYKAGSDCAGEAGSRAYSIVVKLESGADYCSGS